MTLLALFFNSKLAIPNWDMFDTMFIIEWLKRFALWAFIFIPLVFWWLAQTCFFNQFKRLILRHNFCLKWKSIHFDTAMIFIFQNFTVEIAERQKLTTLNCRRNRVWFQCHVTPTYFSLKKYLFACHDMIANILVLVNTHSWDELKVR